MNIPSQNRGENLTNSRRRVEVSDASAWATWPAQGGRANGPQQQVMDNTHQDMRQERERVLVTVGEFSISPSWVHSPRLGWKPLAGSTWNLVDRTAIQTYTPGWAIALAIIGFFFFLIGLLFLLVHETRVVGEVEVTVSGPGYFDFTQLAPASQYAVAELSHRVNYVRGVVASLPVSTAPSVQLAENR